jgi:hypothetical protein
MAPPQVYTAGTYAATYQRLPTVQRSPPVPMGWRPDQFAFRQPPDYATARGEATKDGEIEEGGTPSHPMQPATPISQAAGRQALRALTFEVPMRPLDVSRDMYLDYTTTQSIKFYNKGCEKLSGEAFNGKLLLTWLVQVQDKAMMFTWINLNHKRKATHPALLRDFNGGSESPCPSIPEQGLQSSTECRNADPVPESIHHQDSLQQSLPPNVQVYHIQKRSRRTSGGWSMRSENHH